MAKPTITICFDSAMAQAGDDYPWFTREGEGHEHVPLDIKGDYHTGDENLLAALDLTGDSGYHVELERGDGETVELR